MQFKSIVACVILMCLTSAAWGNLVAKIEETKTTGNKCVLKLSLRNTSDQKIESARAQALLLDDEGKVVGQAVQWVIGGTKDKPPLESKGSRTFHFVIPSGKAFTKTKLSFTRIVLEGGKAGDPKLVQIE